MDVLVCHCVNLGHNWKWANISWCKLSPSLKSLDSFHGCDSEVDIFTRFKTNLAVLGIIVALLARLCHLQYVLDLSDLLLSFYHQVSPENMFISGLGPFNGV